MEDQPGNNGPVDNSGQKSTCQPQGAGRGTKAKIRVRRLRVFTALSILLFSIAQYFKSPFYRFGCVVSGIIFGGLALRIELRNYTATKKNANGWATFVILAGIGIAFYAFFGEKTRPPLSPSFKFTSTWSNRGGHYWFVDEPSPGIKRVTKVDGSILVEFTNLKPDPILVEAYIVEEQQTNGQWHAVEIVEPGSIEHGILYVTTGDNDLNVARELKLTTFTSAFQGKDIDSMKTVRGWVTFKHWPEGNLRLELRDSKTGLVSIEPWSPSIRQDFSLNGGMSEFPIQPQMMEIPTNLVDISRIPKW